VTHDHNNLRFTTQEVRRSQDPDPVWLVNVNRISDNHWLRPQVWLAQEPTPEQLAGLAVDWEAEHGGNDEPPAVHCYACGIRLESDTDTNYQFDNALWIGFHGGYGMFVDACDFPTNTENQWLRDGNGEYLLGPDEKVIRDPDYRPEYHEKRILPGRPDYEAVICHDCAHSASKVLPWLARLIRPEGSHAHAQEYWDAHPEHEGWDKK
jgi:hypothetical protein